MAVIRRCVRTVVWVLRSPRRAVPVLPGGPAPRASPDALPRPPGGVGRDHAPTALAGPMTCAGCCVPRWIAPNRSWCSRPLAPPEPRPHRRLPQRRLRPWPATGAAATCRSVPGGPGPRLPVRRAGYEAAPGPRSPRSTAVGPRAANQDRSFTALDPADGSWVIAVADGVSGNPDGDLATRGRRRWPASADRPRSRPCSRPSPTPMTRS